MSTKEFPCPSCGAHVSFNPKAGKLKCNYCGWEDAIPQHNQLVSERSYEEYSYQNQTKFANLASKVMEVSCSKCSATVQFEQGQVAGQCPFCASPIVTQPKEVVPNLTPEGLIPFTIEAKQARENIQQWLGSHWFAPNSLQKLAQQEKIEGVYLPFWTYDCQTNSSYSGERGEHYYVTETYTETNSEGETETKTREVQHTRWYHASGRVSRFFDDILISATTNLVDKNSLDKLEPWDLKNSLRGYESSYLAGFKAVQAQVSLESGFEQAKTIMESEITSDVRLDIGGDEQRIHNISTDYSQKTFKHVLLPVWISAYRYRNQQYQVIVNARTGEVQGKRPLCAWKVTAAVVTGIAVVAAIIFFFTKQSNTSPQPRNYTPTNLPPITNTR